MIHSERKRNKTNEICDTYPHFSIHDLAHLATELTCQVALLSNIWLQAIKVLSGSVASPRPSNPSNNSTMLDGLRRIDVS